MYVRKVARPCQGRMRRDTFYLFCVYDFMFFSIFVQKHGFCLQGNYLLNVLTMKKCSSYFLARALQFDDFTKMLQNQINSIYCQLFDVPLTLEFIQIED